MPESPARGTGRGRISRRAAVAGLAAAGAGFAAGAIAVRSGALPPPGQAEDASRGEPRQARAAAAEPLFSVAERDRRWQAVRAVMARPQWNLDAIVVTNPGDEAYARYLTQIGGRGGGADVVFPRDPTKPVVAHVGGGRSQRFWEPRLQPWLADGKLVLGTDEGPARLAARLARLGLDAAGTRIGVARLAGTRFHADGLVPSAYMEELRKRLAKVEFLPIERWKTRTGPDPGPIDEVAMVKNAEEQEAVRRSVAAGEEGLRALLREAKRAERQADLWYPTFVAMLLATGEDPTRLSISFDQPANTTLGAPTNDRIESGQIVSQELDATAQGYRAQINHSIFIGGPRGPGAHYYRQAMEIAIELFRDAMASIVPGRTTTGELSARYARRAEELGAQDRGGVALHSSGIGDLSRPRLGPRDVGSGEDDDIVIAPGMTFDFKPAIRLRPETRRDERAENRVVQIGEHVVITASGAERLGRRELVPIFVER